MRTRAWIVGGVLLAGGLALTHTLGPALHPCARLERELCSDLGGPDCARWREQGRPGFPASTPAFRGRGRRALADGVFLLVLGWDPSRPMQVCQGLSQSPSRERLVSAIARVLR